MADENNEYLAVVKVFLQIKDNYSDDFLNYLIETVKQQILNYCNIDEVPSALFYTVCRMVVDIYREEQAKSGGPDENGVVSSISEGGRTVSFGNVSVSDLKISIDEKVSKVTELNRFKRLYRV